MNLRKTLILTLLFLGTLPALSQKVGIKTNLISDAVTSPSLGFEFRMAPRWTFDITGQVNQWNIHERRWRHWMAMPEFRLWYCEAFQGSFWALHLLGGQYNVGNIDTNVKFLGSDFSGLKDHRYEGWAAGAGIGYGYAWMLGLHWNLEFEVGIGWIYTRFDQYSLPCIGCETLEEKNKAHNYFGPTKLALSLEYLF